MYLFAILQPDTKSAEFAAHIPGIGYFGSFLD